MLCSVPEAASDTAYLAGVPPDSSIVAALSLERLRACDREAFTALVREHHRVLRTQAACIVGEAWADDALQEAWLVPITRCLGSRAGPVLRTGCQQ